MNIIKVGKMYINLDNVAAICDREPVLGEEENNEIIPHRLWIEFLHPEAGVVLTDPNEVDGLLWYLNHKATDVVQCLQVQRSLQSER